MSAHELAGTGIPERQREGQQKGNGCDSAGTACARVEMLGTVRQTGGSCAKYLKDNFLMYREFGDDVCQK